MKKLLITPIILGLALTVVQSTFAAPNNASKAEDNQNKEEVSPCFKA